MTGEQPLSGTGFQDGDDGLSYLAMPREMQTYLPPGLPEDDELAGCPEVLAVLARLQVLLACCLADGRRQRLALDGLSGPALTLLGQILGEGEVAIQIQDQPAISLQETVLAGVWWGQQPATGQQWLEVADIPGCVLQRAFATARWPLLEESGLPDGLINARPVLAELLEAARQQAVGPQAMAHVVNLSLLPFSAEDLAFLQDRLGAGPVVLLSRGYGSCRISSTATPGIWWVQYFNSTDQLILDTLEVTAIPQVACAAREDLEDSAGRLQDIREALA